MEFQQRYQDLIWAAESQSLIRNDLTTELLSQAQRDRLRRGDFVEAFDSFLSRREKALSHKVGLYFELLVEFLISEVIQGKMTVRGQQVVENGRTVGEVDFIFELDGSTWHLETAVKFYLFNPEAWPEVEGLVGPNSSDNFEAKMDRLFGQQLPLSQTAFPDVTKRVAYVKGRIFYPHHSAASTATETKLTDQLEQLNVDHVQGIWCRAADCAKFLAQLTADRFAVRKKPHWLADVRLPFDSSEVLTCSQLTFFLVQHFQESKRPLMLSSVRETDGVFTEVERIFVVDDTWPS